MVVTDSLPALAPGPDSTAGRVPGPIIAPPGSVAPATPAEATSSYLWVTRSSLLRPADVDRLVLRAKAAGVRGLLVQVVGRGDAYYDSDLLPRSEALPATCAGCVAFDPLAAVIERAHASGLEVHAWMNALLVWSAPQPPRDPRHVVNAHPEWIARLADGRSMMRLGPAERRRLGTEGVFLTPAQPAVRTWIASIAQEIVRRYPVDGIHLDYIRQPGSFVGYDADTRARFALECGVDPARFRTLAPARRAAMDSAWSAFQRAQVTAIVREVRDSIEVLRPGLALSAAVLADSVSAEIEHAQPWRAWLHDGLLDRVYVMCYAPQVQTVMAQMLAYASELGTSGRVVPGIAVFNSSAAMAAAKIKGALALGYRTLALYSYDSLEQRPGYWAALLNFVGASADGTHRGGPVESDAHAR
jgi:uncharacterized lipoprotein YddW (UPF0748 family)